MTNSDDADDTPAGSPPGGRHTHLTPALILALEQMPTLRPFLDHLCQVCPQCQQAALEAMAIRRRALESENALFQPSKALAQARKIAGRQLAAAARDLAEIEGLISDPALAGTTTPWLAACSLVRDAPADRFTSPVLVADCLEKAREATRAQRRSNARLWALLGHLVACRNINPAMVLSSERQDDAWRANVAGLYDSVTPDQLGLLAETSAAVSRTVRQAGNPGQALEFLSEHAATLLGDPKTSELVPIDALLEFQLERGAVYLALRKYDAALSDLETAYGHAVALGDPEELGKTGIYLGMALRHRDPQRACELVFWAIEEPISPYLQASAVNEAVMILLLDLNKPEEALKIFQRYEEKYFQCTDRGNYVCDRHSWAVARFKAAFGEPLAALEHYAALLARWESEDTEETAAPLNVALVVLEMAVIQLERGEFAEVERLAASSAATFAAAKLEANAAEAFELVRSAAECRRLTIAELWRVHRYLRNPEALTRSYAVSS